MQSFIQKTTALVGLKSIFGGLSWVCLVSLWLWFLSVDHQSDALLQRASEYPYNWLVLILLGIVGMVLLLPGIMITVSAGYLFGLLKGVMLVLVATTIGATIAFLLGRRVFKQPLLKHLDVHHPVLLSLNSGLRENGGLIVFLTRLLPFFPFKLSNYYFGAADYRMRGFVIGTFLGIIPITALNVYIGTALARITSYTSAAEESMAMLWLTLLSAVALALLVSIIGRQAARSLTQLKDKTQTSTATSKEQNNV